MIKLYLALKKDIFEELLNRTGNEIHIKKSPWWRKRLMDLDTGRFKHFDTAVVSCGSHDKYMYPITGIIQKGDEYVITVNLDGCSQEDSDQDVQDGNTTDEPKFTITTVRDGDDVPEAAEPSDEQETGQAETEEETDDDDIQEDSAEPSNTDDVPDEENDPDSCINFNADLSGCGDENQEYEKRMRMEIIKKLNEFCEKPGVFVVNLPNVVIRNNGTIIGNGKRLFTDADSDVRMDFKRMEFTRYNGISEGEFIYYIFRFLRNKMVKSYVFINKKGCGFYENDFGETVFVVTMVSKKKYLFGKRG